MANRTLFWTLFEVLKTPHKLGLEKVFQQWITTWLPVNSTICLEENIVRYHIHTLQIVVEQFPSTQRPTSQKTLLCKITKVSVKPLLYCWHMAVDCERHECGTRGFLISVWAQPHALQKQWRWTPISFSWTEKTQICCEGSTQGRWLMWVNGDLLWDQNTVWANELKLHSDAATFHERYDVKQQSAQKQWSHSSHSSVIFLSFYLILSPLS